MKTFKNEIIIICFEAGKLSASFFMLKLVHYELLLLAFRSIEKGLEKNSEALKIYVFLSL